MFSFILIGGILLLGAMSPGPDFVVVTKNSTLHSRRAGIFTALGVGAAILVHATYSLAGLGLIIGQSIIAFSVIKWLGALYLLCLGISLLRSKGSSAETFFHTADSTISSPMSSKKAFLEGFGTNLLNPKAALFFIGIFSQVIGLDATLVLKAGYVLEAALVIAAWFVALAWFLNIGYLRTTLQHALKPIEKIMGALLVFFAIKLALERA